MKNLTLVTDVAVGAHMDLESSARMVGEVMMGETGLLKPHGIVVQEGADALQVMRERFQGFSERDAGTLEGHLKQIANGWDNIKESIGRGLQGLERGTGDVNRFADALNRIGLWIDQHNRGFEVAGKGLSFVGSTALHAVQDMFTGGGSSASQLGNALLNHRIGATGSEHATVGPIAWTQFGQELNPEVLANDRKMRAEQAERDRTAAEASQEKQIDQLKQEYDLLTKTAKITGLKADDYAKMAAIVAELERTARGSSSLANRAAAADFVASVMSQRNQQLNQTDTAAAKLSAAGINLGALQAQGVHTIGESQIGVRASAAATPTVYGAWRGFGTGVRESFEDAFGGADAFEGIDAALGSLEQRMQSFTGGAMANFFGAWQDGIADVIQWHESLGSAAIKVARRAIGGSLAADAQDTMFRAAKAAALALTDPSGVHWLQAGKLFGIGTAELGAAAALSGGGGGGGGGYGALSSSGISATQADAQSRGKTTVILNGKGLNFENPDDLDALVGALRELGNTGDIEVIVRGGKT